MSAMAAAQRMAGHLAESIINWITQTVFVVNLVFVEPKPSRINIDLKRYFAANNNILSPVRQFHGSQQYIHRLSATAFVLVMAANFYAGVTNIKQSF
jgi:hypothetical protein